MKQILNIVRKDLRRYWRENAVSVALLVAYAWNEVRGWAGERDVATSGGIGGFISYQFLSGLVIVLLPVAWSFLIVRLVQGEALVGDRQFWITRPYEWKKLLAAKILFLVLTINLPLLIADFFLLAKAGFPPTHYVIGLLWMQLLLALILILPVATLATVTASVVQMILTVLGIVLYAIGVAALASVILSSSFSGPVSSIMASLLIATCVAVIAWQYARRKTAGARCLILGLALVIVLIVVATPYNAIVNREFPRIGPGEPLPVKLALLPPNPSPDVAVADDEKEVVINIPLSTSGIAADSIVALSGVMLSVEAPEGLRWNSGWNPAGITLFPDQESTQLSFTLKKKFFDRVKSEAVKARIAFAFTVYRDQNRRAFVIPNGEFLMADVGFCSAEASYLREIHCRAPLRTPSSIMITSDLLATTCAPREGESRSVTGRIARDWNQNPGSGPAEFGISPVKSLNLFLWGHNASDRHTISGLCPGTPLIISSPVFVGASATELEFNGVRLADYRLRHDISGATGIVFSIWH